MIKDLDGKISLICHSELSEESSKKSYFNPTFKRGVDRYDKRKNLITGFIASSE
jgi:hypothetical protein